MIAPEKAAEANVYKKEDRTKWLNAHMIVGASTYSFISPIMYTTATASAFCWGWNVLAFTQSSILFSSFTCFWADRNCVETVLNSVEKCWTVRCRQNLRPRSLTALVMLLCFGRSSWKIPVLQRPLFLSLLRMIVTSPSFKQVSSELY